MTNDTDVLIFGMLLYGAKNSISQSTLAKQLGISRRALRRKIQLERLAGYPICASDHGYHKPANRMELEQWIRSMRGRGREIERVADAVESAAGEAQGVDYGETDTP